MKEVHLSIITAFMLLAACGSGNHHEDAGKAVKVSLNNGERWEANIETTQGIWNMQEILAPHSGEATADLQKCKSLGAALQTELDGIIQKCTMTGDAHEQLHNFLTPLFGLVKQLQKENSEECMEAARLLKVHLDGYDKYFKS